MTIEFLFFFFFFQAEDGIRDRTVTGVQTCALPISPRGGHRLPAPRSRPPPRRPGARPGRACAPGRRPPTATLASRGPPFRGRASPFLRRGRSPDDALGRRRRRRAPPAR